MHEPGASLSLRPVPPRSPEIFNCALDALVGARLATWSHSAVESHRAALRTAVRQYNASLAMVAVGAPGLFQIVSADAGTFDGTGISGPLVLGGYGGHVYTGDVAALRARTGAYAWHATTAHAAVVFIGPDRKIAGHFQGGGLGLAVGVGCGEGKWR